MNKRSFLGTLAGGAALVVSQMSGTTKQKDYQAISVFSGEAVFEAINRAKLLAKEKNVEVVFVFNYIDHFRVFPSGRWQCRREGGGMPVCGPDSEFVPSEGWIEFYGH